MGKLGTVRGWKCCVDVKIIAVSESYNLPIKPRVFISSSLVRKNYISLHNEGWVQFILLVLKFFQRPYSNRT